MNSDLAPAELLDAVSQAVIVTDAEGAITHWNSHAERLYGWRREEVIGTAITNVTPTPEHVQVDEEILKRLKSGSGWGGQRPVRHRDGHKFEVLVIAAPVLQGGRLTGIIGVSIPVDAEPSVEERLTPRERQVARLTAQAMTSAQIAATLGIGIRTVESHRANLYRKLGIRTRFELIAIAFQKGTP